MVLKVTGVQQRKSMHGGTFYYVFFKGDDGKSYRTHAYPEWKGKPVGNFRRWKELIEKYREVGNTGEEVFIDNVIFKKETTIVDADSRFQYVRMEKNNASSKVAEPRQKENKVAETGKTAHKESQPEIDFGKKPNGFRFTFGNER